MKESATRFLTLTVCATALMIGPMVTSAKAATNSNEQGKVKKIQPSPGFNDPRSTDRTSATCFRAIDCATWPPRIDDDPDRKAGGAGGM
jgi:hypothetical protein